jgi:hypothetical protein
MLRLNPSDRPTAADVHGEKWLKRMAEKKR